MTGSGEELGFSEVVPTPEAEEEPSPDSLRNTADNIARLEDVIEQCEGRQKYLAQTRSTSDGSDVRWYFCKVPLAQNELAASFPQTEIVGKGDYFRFGMRDSLAIEASFLQREEELLSYWWKEYAECSEGPRVRPKKLDPQTSASKLDDAESTEVHDVEEERVGVPVKGGLYEVDLVRRHCFPVYWNGENRRVLRGHWFARKGGLDWLPLREDVAEQLEIAYRSRVWRRRSFQPSGLFAARVDLHCTTLGLYALFTGEDDTWEAWLNLDASGFSSFIALNGNGIKLRRGYALSNSPKPTQDELRQQKEEEMDDYCSQVPVRHLVFMVHGIGQRLEKSNLVDDVANFRHITASLAERNLTSHQRSTQRVLFIPCQWRKGLKLSGESAVEKITLDGVKGLRVMLSATVHDVLYYMSPIYCQDIIDSVSNQLNRLYLKFLKRNPGYDGKVSIYAHSLGSVLSYDILCHQENLSSPFPMDWMYKEHEKNEENTHDPKEQSYSSKDVGNKEFAAVDASKDQMDPIDKEKQSRELSSSIQMEQHSEDFFTSAEPVKSDLHEVGASALESGSSSEESGDQSVCDAKVGDSDQATRVDGATHANCSGETNEDLDDITGNKEVIKLREEIESLKAKIAYLEAQGCGKEKMTTYMPDQPISQKLSSGHDGTPKSYTPYIKYTKLEFKVDTFFAVGSPLGVFLSLRNIRLGIGKGKNYWEEENISEEMPACRRMFNIFHPYDPVAYRVEPLVCKEYLSKRPVIIPYHKGGKRLHIGFQEFTEDLAARSQAIVYRLNSVRVKVLTACQSRESDKLEEAEESPQGQEERSYGSLMMERLTGSEEGRIDYMLQDKTFEHPYLQAIGSHTNYWRDNDTALFILKHLYSDISEDPPSPKESGGGNLKSETSGSEWSDKRETVDEELPLTFSDRIMARNFSSKAKKFMKRA